MADYKVIISRLLALKASIPRIVGNEMINEAHDNLRNESFEGKKYVPRKSGSPRDQGRRLLLDTGDGERSIRIQRESGERVDLTANDYMQAHNEGATIRGTFNVRSHIRRRNGRSEQVSAHSRTVDTKLPERPFIKATAKLIRRVNGAIFKRLIAILK
jgi:hypothetical protein